MISSRTHLVRTAPAALLALALAACQGPSSHEPAATASASPSPSPAPRASASAKATVPPIRITSVGGGGQPVRIDEVQGGRLRYDIVAQATEATTGAGGASVATFTRPRIRFHDRSGKITTADAPRATVTERDKSVLMQGGVTMRTADGGELRADTVRYDGATERVRGEGHVVLVRRSSDGVTTLTGDRFDGDLRLQNFRVTRAAG